MTTMNPYVPARPTRRTAPALAAGLTLSLLLGVCVAEDSAHPAASGSSAAVALTPASVSAGTPTVRPVHGAKTLTAPEIRAAIAEAEELRRRAVRPDPAVSEAVAKRLAERWGIQVQGVRRTAGGYMLDFRFRVVEAEKALPLFDHRIDPYVLAEHSQIKLPVPMAPKVGAFRPTNRGKNIKPDKTYFMVFGNPDSYLKAGQKVSVVIGDFRAEHLTVR